ncbi:MAG: tetratricopeptide repeat protein [Maricaulaceae bacterium]
MTELFERPSMPRMFTLPLSVFAACMVSCATPTSGPDYSLPEGRLFGEYLAGSYASEIDDAEASSDYYSKAFSRLRSDTSLGRRAVTAALRNGDYDLARTQARDVLAEDPSESMARIILGARAFSRGEYSKTGNYFNAPTPDRSMAMIMGLLQGWSEAQQGNYSDSEALFQGLQSWTYFNFYGKLQLGKIYALQGKTDEAVKLFAEVGALGIAPTETAMSQARALVHAGRSEEALKGLKDLSVLNGGFETGPMAWAIAELEAGRDLGGLLSPKQEAARALTEPAFGFFQRNDASDVAEIYLRLARSIDPDNEKTKLWLASLLEQFERPDEAEKLYNDIDLKSPYDVQAELSLATLYLRKDEDDKALAILEKSYARKPVNATRETLGRVRIFRENYEEALPVYESLVASLTEQELKADVEPLYFRGICYERLEQWDNAVADFRRVLEIDPDNADALNYLGYTWVDRGENLTEAFEMIRKAVELEPDSGAIVDSLGWAHYKLGEYEDAKTNLENAVALTPASATIVDHLGDVYWKLGRLREAGYQWKRALDFDPTDEERANIETKLQGGFDSLQASP